MTCMSWNSHVRNSNALELLKLHEEEDGTAVELEVADVLLQLDINMGS